MTESGGRKKVLVVDDEPGVGKVVSIKLRLTGYEVITTTRGAEAADLVRKEKPDILLLDILMPETTGFDVLEKVRAFSDLPIIVFTARPDIFKLAKSMGADDFIAKPFNPAELAKKVDEVLEARSGQTGKTCLAEMKTVAEDDESR